MALEVNVRDDAGVRYRVHDAAFGPPLAAAGRRMLLPLGDPRARYRLFVPADPAPMLRVYDFKVRGGEHGISVEILDGQFRAAGYAPKRSARPLAAAEGRRLTQGATQIAARIPGLHPVGDRQSGEAASETIVVGHRRDLPWRPREARTNGSS